MQLRLIVLSLLFCFAACSGSATNTNTVVTTQPSPTSTSATPSTQQQTVANNSTKAKPKLDACAMLTSQEIESVQGEALKESKLSESTAEGFYVSQCFFTLPTFTNSISLVITQKGDGSGARNPREFWNDRFHEKGAEREEREREREEGEERPPQKVTGIGDEAFWMSSRAASILYVLKRDSYVRISIGGQADQPTKLKKSKALARKVIDRL
jgi:uncharacterized protein DUF3558